MQGINTVRRERNIKPETRCGEESFARTDESVIHRQEVGDDDRSLPT